MTKYVRLRIGARTDRWSCRRGSWWVALLVPVLVATVGCETGPGREMEDSAQRAYRGIVIDPPAPRPDIVMADVRGTDFDLEKETEGRLLFLFIGYTNCPDVCPVHMANLASVLGQRSEWDARTTVVFVTADPERDTPERMREWLGAFSSKFVGLRGTREEVNALEDALKLPRSILPEARDTFYTVGHAAHVVAFSPDGRQLLYPFGTRQEDFAHDIPRLLAEVDRGAE